MSRESNMKNRANEKCRSVRIIASFLIGCFAITITSVAYSEEKWPAKPITVVVGFGVGGSADRVSRAMASFLPDELGQPVLVVNKKGAGSQLAATYVLQQPSDCNTIFGSALSPFLQQTILKGGAQYSLDDFAFLNGQWFDYDLMFTGKDSPYTSFKDLFEAVKAHPKKVKMAMIKGGSAEVNVQLTMEALGIPYENLNVVTYSSGSANRTSTAGGTTDFTVIAGEGTKGVRDLIRPLAIYREAPHPDWDAPVIENVVEEMGGNTKPAVGGSMRGFAVSAECKKQHPDRFNKLVAAIKGTLAKKDVQKFLKRSDIGGVFIGPEKTTQRMKADFDLYAKYDKTTAKK